MVFQRLALGPMAALLLLAKEKYCSIAAKILAMGPSWAEVAPVVAPVVAAVGSAAAAAPACVAGPLGFVTEVGDVNCGSVEACVEAA